MKKSSLAIIGLSAVVIAVVVFGSPKDNIQDSDYAYHVNLSESKYGENGIYEESFEIGDQSCQRFCDYKFRFVPNGDSPQKLSIKLLTESGVVLMDNHFELEGTLIDNGISSWYTWDYLSNDNMLKIDESQQVKILISPNGNLKGPVSIGIVSIK